MHNLSCENEFYLHENEKMISISKAEHLPSCSNRDPGELGNGPFKEAEIKCAHFLYFRKMYSANLLKFVKSLTQWAAPLRTFDKILRQRDTSAEYYELKADKRLLPQAAQTKGVSISWTKWEESSNLPWTKIVQKSKYNNNSSTNYNLRGKHILELPKVNIYNHLWT